ncbi:MAG TPA: dual specificity protein phosphatase [Phycisphaerae bacterium]|jgi:protein-tyrosine phosphatase
MLAIRVFLERPPAPDSGLSAFSTYTQIETGLYVGGRVKAPPPGIGAVLCLSELQDDYQSPVHEWRPIHDSAPGPSLDWLRQQVEFVDAQRRKGLSVFIHCDAGISRGPMVTAAYLMWRDHLSRDDALALLETKRPQVHPNLGFMKLLAEWEKTVRGKV